MAESNLKINITGDSSKLKNALSSASSKLQAFGGKMQSVGKSMSTSLTLPLVAAGTAATKLALDFDKSMTQIESLVGIAANEVAKMGEAAKTMATATGRSANEAGEALFFITSAGLRGADATDTLNASLKAAAVGLGETKTIADLATSAMNAYGVENLNATGATDILVASVREGKLEASELAGAMGGVIPIASNMGVGFDEVGAALAAMSRTGTNAAVGATQLTAILASIKKPTQQSAEAMLALGTSQEQISKSLAEKGLMPTLMDLSARLKATGMDATAIFPNIRALKGVLDLTGKGAADNQKIFEALGNTLGATDEAFQKTSESASFKFAQGMATVKNALLEIGQIVLPAVITAVTKLSEFVKGLADRFKNLSPQTQKIVLTFTAILAAAGPLLIIFGKLMTGITALGPILTIAATGFRVLTMAMAANPIIAIASAIALVVAALYSYSKAQKEATAASVAQLDTKAIDERLKAAEEELAYMDTLEAKRRYSIGAQKSRNERLKNEIALLKERKSVLEEQAKAEIPKITVPVEVVPASDSGQAAAGGGDITTSGAGGGGRGAVSSVVDLGSGGIMTPITNAIKADTAGIPAAIAEQQAVLSEQQAIALENAAMFNAEIGNIITGGLNQLATGIGEALGQALAGGGNLAEKLSKVVLTTIGTMAVQMGKLAIQIGIGVEAIKKALQSLNPAVAIAAGIALIALGSFAKAQAGKISTGGGGGGAKAFANGGIVSGPTMGLVGEYPGARQNPEVIAPLNKLQSMIGGGGQNINVGGQIRLEGQDLLIAIQRANETADRLF